MRPHTQYSSVNRRPLLPEGEWGRGVLVSVSQQTLPRGSEGKDNIVNCCSLTRSVLVEVVCIRLLAPMFLFHRSPTASLFRYPAIFMSLHKIIAVLYCHNVRTGQLVCGGGQVCGELVKDLRRHVPREVHSDIPLMMHSVSLPRQRPPPSL